MVCYSFYTQDYHGGSVSAEDWADLEREASATLAGYKRNYNVTGTELDEKMAVCAMVEVLDAYAETGSPAGAVSSASIGSVSESYKSATGAEYAARRCKDVYNAARRYLGIYRGVSL